MGVVCAVVADDNVIQVDKVARIDLARCLHSRVPASLCTLYHSNATCDRVAHFLQEWDPWLTKAHAVLIERQPPGGFKDVEALLQHCLRDKVHVIQPQSVHAHFGLPQGDYDRRKELTVALASPYMLGVAGWGGLERKHDVADAMCQLLWWLSKQPRKRKIPEERNEFWTYAFDSTDLKK